jgi:hypothetical protein
MNFNIQPSLEGTKNSLEETALYDEIYLILLSLSVEAFTLPNIEK